jgi:Ca2+-binding RTX toxin-like protein
MVSVVLGTKITNFSFDISNIDLSTLKGTDPEYTISKNGDIVLSESKSDYVILSGSFNLSGFAKGDYADGIKQLEAITVVTDGKIVYKASGLGITGAEVGSASALDAYLAEKGYSIKGNNFSNELTSGDINDMLHGLSGNDTINGMAGADKLFGDDGNDRIVGGEGNDFLSGGKGADVFEFAAGDGSDVILDFQARGKGQDHIDLSGHGDVSSFEDLVIADAGKNVVINVVITVGDDTITLKNVNDHDISATDFQF